MRKAKLGHVRGGIKKEKVRESEKVTVLWRLVCFEFAEARSAWL